MSESLSCARCGRANPADAAHCSVCGIPLIAATESDGSQPGAGHARAALGTFFGREDELAALRAALDMALTGNGRLAMLAGDAGIGKTRLAQELAQEAARRAILVRWGRCFEEPGAPPYWPWIQALRTHLASLDDAQLREQAGPDAASLAELVPELRQRVADPAPLAPAADPDQARFRLFGAMARFWSRAAAERGLVLVFDDLHWADASSLRLLAFLPGEIADSRILVLGTYREAEFPRQHPLTETLAELTRWPQVHRMQLSGLSLDETHCVMTTAAGSEPAASLVAAVHRRTEGHPLFLVETVRFLLQDGRSRAGWNAVPAEALRQIPTGVREVIGKRLNRLSSSCCRLLGIAACIGRSFDLELFGELAPETSDEAVLAALDEARAAHVVDQLSQPDRYRFSHELIREAVYDELLAARRVRLHRRIGELLEARHRDDLEPYVPQLAYHFGEAAAAGAADKALAYARRAAARATELLAHEDAARFYRLALELQQAHFPQDRASRCKLLLGLAAAENWAGANETCQAIFADAADLARQVDSTEDFVEAALGFEAATWRSGKAGEQAAALLLEAMARPQQGDERGQVDLLAAQCRAYVFCNRPREAKAAYAKAVTLARRIGEPHALFRALSALMAARFWPDLLEERMAAAREALAVAERAAHLEWAVGDLTGWYIGDLVEVGDVAAAKELVATHMRMAEAMRQPYLLAGGLSGKTMLAIHEGRFADAEATAGEMLAVGRRAALANADGVYGMQMFTLRREQGRLGEVLPVLREFLRTTPRADIWRPALALVCAELGLENEARTEFDALAGDGFATLPRDSLWLTCVTYLADVCVILGDVARAPTLYALMQPYAGRNAVTGTTVSQGAVDRYLGMLASALGRRDEAARHFEVALECDTRSGAHPWLAHTRYEYARLLHSRGDDAQRASLLLQQALATCRELGMAGLERRCLALQDVIARRLVFPDGLSQREVDVLRLVVAGKSNSEIGTRLFISPNTVANHIRRILAKTGTANRTEAAIYAIRRGLGSA